MFAKTKWETKRFSTLQSTTERHSFTAASAALFIGVSSCCEDVGKTANALQLHKHGYTHPLNIGIPGSEQENRPPYLHFCDVASQCG